MASRRRWSHLIHSFRAGVLSPSVQDQIDSDAWLQGAARLDNLSVERDGGVRGRPPFLNGAEIPKVKWNLLKRKDKSTAVVSNPAGAGNPDDGWEFTLTAPVNDLLTITFPSPEVKPRSIVFHRMVLLDAVLPGRLVYTVGGKTDRNFRLYARRSGQSAFDQRVNAIDAPEGRDLTDPGLFWGHVMPGTVPRDVVVPLRTVSPALPTTELHAVTGLQLRVGDADATGKRFRLRIGGVSVLSEDDDLSSTYEPVSDGYDDAYRLIPWVIQGKSYALVLGMDYSAVYAIDDLELIAGRGAMLRNPNTDMQEEVVFAPGSFSYRQIRELTWTPYGGGLLLFHRDFVRPIRVRLDVGPELKMEVLGTRGIADLTDQLESLRAPAI